MLEHVSGARQPWSVVGKRVLLILLITAALASTILAAKAVPPEDMGCGFDYSGLPIPCQPR